MKSLIKSFKRVSHEYKSLIFPVFESFKEHTGPLVFMHIENDGDLFLVVTYEYENNSVCYFQFAQNETENWELIEHSPLVLTESQQSLCKAINTALREFEQKNKE